MKLTAKQWKARGEAWNEAAEHLLQDWSHSRLEASEGEKVSDMCQRKATECFERAKEAQQSELGKGGGRDERDAHTS